VDETTGFVTEVAEKRVISNAATRAVDRLDRLPHALSVQHDT
jgi:hypothetical protein